MALSSDGGGERGTSERHRDSTSGGEHPWTLLSNYAHVLVCIARDPDLTLREIADFVGVTERAVHRIVGELESVGVIRIERAGRRNHYELDMSARLRHPLESDCTVGDLLGALIKDESGHEKSA